MNNAQQQCCSCKVIKDFSFFGKSKNAKHGYARVCKECRHLEYVRDQEKVKQKAKEWKRNNPSKRLENNRRWRKENLELDREVKRNWASRHKEYGAFRRSLYRNKQLQATPKWADLDKIKEMYLNCPKGFHVDHIIPLQGKTVSGLHVDYNLQYLSAKENLSKGNKFELSECTNFRRICQ